MDINILMKYIHHNYHQKKIVSSFAMCIRVSQLLHFVVGIFGNITLFCLFVVIITYDECKLAFECGVNNGHSIDFVQS
jgi:hypothetical protein